MTVEETGTLSAASVAAPTSVVLTDEAAFKVKHLLDQEGRDDLALRIAVQPGGCSGLRYQLFFDERSLDGDVVTDFDGVNVVVDRMSVPYLDRRDDRLRRHDREAGLHDRQPQRDRLVRLRRLVPLEGTGKRRPRAGAAPARTVGCVPAGQLSAVSGCATSRRRRRRAIRC